MRFLPEGRYPLGPGSCMGAEILRQVLADEKSAHLLVTEVSPDAAPDLSSEEPGASRRLGRREWVCAHVICLLIGAWNFFLVNLARTPDTWWF